MQVDNAPWTFPVDRPARRSYFDDSVFAHPAKIHLGLLQRLIDLYTEPGETLLDPMAGSGSLMIAAAQQRNVILRDIQPEYVAMMQYNAPLVHWRAGLLSGLIDIDQADARYLVCPPFDHIITSPPYGFETGSGMSNRRRAELLGSAKFGARWKRYLENPNHASVAAGFRYPGGQDNIGNKSGRNYWAEMRAVYSRLGALLPSGGRLILILKNHYRRGKLIDVVSQTVSLAEGFSLELEARHQRLINNPSLWQRRRREKGLPIVDKEDVLVFCKSQKGGEDVT